MKPDKPGWWFYEKENCSENPICIRIYEGTLGLLETLEGALHVKRWLGQAHPPKIKNLEWLTTTLDCGDNSCIYRDPSKPSGMRTNSGCGCFEDLDPKRRLFVNRMFMHLKEFLIDD